MTEPLCDLLLNLSELDSAVERCSLLAGEGVGRVVAGEGLLVKDGAVAADEGPLGGLDDGAEVVLNRQADVEDLAVVVNIGVVTNKR